MADSSVIITVGMDIDDAEKDLDRLGKRVIKLQNDLNETKGKKTSLEQEFERANEELKKLYATAARDKNDLLPPDEAVKLEQLEQHAAWLGEQIEKTKDQEIIDKAALDGAKTAYGKFAAEVERVHALEQEQKNAEAQRLAEIAANAEVADQKIVDLVAELDALKARQTELQSAGVGLGFQEFDDNARRITEINAELNEYRANIRSADAEEERLGKNTSGASEGMRRAAGFADKFASRLIFQSALLVDKKDAFRYTVFERVLFSTVKGEQTWQSKDEKTAAGFAERSAGTHRARLQRAGVGKAAGKP